MGAIQDRRKLLHAGGWGEGGSEGESKCQPPRKTKQKTLTKTL